MKLLEKIEIFRKFAFRNRFCFVKLPGKSKFLEICLEKFEIVLTRIHDPIFQTKLTPQEYLQVKYERMVAGYYRSRI